MNITHHKNGEIKTLVEEAPYNPGYEDVNYEPIPFAGYVKIKINTLELANLLEVDSWYKLVTREEIATMLRQQQAEIDLLRMTQQNIDYDKELLKPTFVGRELTDEEIEELAMEYLENTGKGIVGVYDFVSAILQKANNG